MEKIDYYIGINLIDIDKLIEFMSVLNTDIDVKLHITVMNTYDDPHGYYTFCIRGTWESYKRFLNNEESWVKSVNHFEE